MVAGAAALTAWLGLAIGCADARPSFVLVVADTLRLDHLDFAGGSVPTPSFAALRAESIWFPNAWAPASFTLPSIASLFTARLVSEHRAERWGDVLPDDEPTLAGLLGQAGYRSSGWNANFLLANSRVERGFDHYETLLPPEHGGSHPGIADAEQVTRGGVEWLDELRNDAPDAPFLLYLHYMEPHSPYACTPEDGPACPGRSVALNPKLTGPAEAITADERAMVVRGYATSVAQMDAALGELLRALDADTLLDDAWLVLVADHGEQLGERELFLHGNSLFEPLVHIPLLVRPPGGRRGRSDAQVSLLDVAPTLLDLAGVPAPPSWRGRSLRPALEGGRLASRPVISEHLDPDPRAVHRLSLVDGDVKLLLGRDGSVVRYRLGPNFTERDPTPVAAAELEARLVALGLPHPSVEERAGDRVEEPAPRLTEQQRSELRSLGYLP